ncbi:copper chaperone [Sinomonas sp. RB5]
MAGQAHLAARNRSALLVLLGWAAIAWYFLGTGDMSPGPGTMGLDLAGFLLVWSLMMAAMMFPALAPLATAYLRSLRAVPDPPLRAARTAALVAGYLVSWAVFGAIAFVLALLAAQLAMGAPAAAAYCIGCCWGLMLVLTAVGLTNLAWMAAIAATVLLEKTWSHGRGLSRTVGVALIVFACFVPANPALLPGLHAPAQMQAAASVVHRA